MWIYSNANTCDMDTVSNFEDIYFVVNNDGTVSFANQHACVFFNTDPNSINKAVLWANYPGRDVLGAMAACNFVQVQKQPKLFFDQHQKNEIDFKLSMLPVTDGVAIVCRALSDRATIINTLSKTNERFDLLAKATNDIVWDWNLLTDELWWNDNYKRCFGYVHYNNTNHISEWLKNVHEDDRLRVKATIYAAITEGKTSWVEEYRYLDVKGHVFDIFDRGYLLYNESGKAYRMIGCMQDITERKNSAKAIAASEEKYRNLVEQASDGILTVDMSGKILSVNTATCGLFRYSEKELLNMYIQDFLPPDKKDSLEMERIKAGETVIKERTLIAKDGTCLNVETMSNMLSDGRILGFVRDVDERVKARTQILSEKYFSDTVINSLPGIFYLHDEKGNILRWNKNLEVTTGFDADEIPSLSPILFYRKQDADLVREKMRLVFNSGFAYAELPIIHKNGIETVYFLKGMKVTINNIDCVLVIGLDYSKKFEAEQQLKTSLAEIRRLASHLTQIREEERKRIGREIHDELGQQITAMKMEVAWIQKNLSPNEKVILQKIQNMIKLLESGNQSVRRILNELNAGAVERHGLLDAIERLNIQVEQNTTILINFSASHAFIELPDDVANCVFRVYQESLNNILKHSQASEIVSSCELVDDFIVLTIRDNGVGFSVEEQKDTSGFGLLGMKERVIAKNGSFAVHSTPGAGTEIRVQIPL